MTPRVKALVFRREGLVCFLCGWWCTAEDVALVQLVEGDTHDPENFAMAHSCCADFLTENRRPGRQMDAYEDLRERFRAWDPTLPWDPRDPSVLVQFRALLAEGKPPSA